MAKKFTNVETYIVIIFLFAILGMALGRLGLELTQNPNSDLDNDSIEYITKIRNIDFSEYNATRPQIEDQILLPGNVSQSNPKEEALEFLFAKEKGSDMEIIIKGIFSLPETILIDWLRFNVGDWNWIIGIFNWLYRILVIIAIIFFVRGIVRT